MPISKSKINNFFRRLSIHIRSFFNMFTNCCNNCCSDRHNNNLHFNNPNYGENTTCFTNPIYQLQFEEYKKNNCDNNCEYNYDYDYDSYDNVNYDMPN